MVKALLVSKSAQTEFMQRALLEAAKARGRTRPNPMVGCAVVKNGALVSVGHHVKAGMPHAEVVALGKAGEAARGADIYITLEPCDHMGRTGPCTERLIRSGVKRVFVACRDPNPIVNGRGIRRLRKAGIRVVEGVLHDECRELNEAYETFMRKNRPLVAVKVAQSLDGRVATRTGNSQWITSREARREGHRLRNEHDAILVGVGTALADDPQLTCRRRGGRDPVRVVLDSQARLSPKSNLARLGASSKVPTWLFCGARAPAARKRALERVGVEVISVKGARGRLDLGAVLESLAAREILSVLVEGGPTVVGGFFDAGLVDKVHAFVAPMIIGGEGALSSVAGIGPADLARASRLSRVSWTRVGPDFHLVGYVGP